MLEIEKHTVPRQFESAYLEVRGQEQRILTTEEIRQLPHLAHHSHAKEWRQRQGSTNRLLNYLMAAKPKRVLDLGCGNGWLLYKIAPFVPQPEGIDVNLRELEQAAVVLAERPHVLLRHCDVFETALIPGYDCIICNASIQYFPDLTLLLKRLLALLSPEGEVLLVDSPLYKASEVAAAKERSKAYYTQMGTAHMSAYYHHHTWSALASFRYTVLYNPAALLQRLKNRIKANDSPFPLVSIKKSP